MVYPSISIVTVALAYTVSQQPSIYPAAMPLVVPKTNDLLKVQLSTSFIMISSLFLRVGFLLFGLYQDKYLKLPYTDIDYFVFTDASKFVFNGGSPFERATYRYTPLLAWLLLPTNYWFEFGKIVFVICDLVTGYLIMKILAKNRQNKMLSLIWLWNPMVITISTRGSSESLLTITVLGMLYTSLQNQYILCGLITGIAIHLKIYPLIYIPTILMCSDVSHPLLRPFTANRLKFLFSAAFSFITLTATMYYYYGDKYIFEAYLYHLSRLDHRHNFSIYNISLYFSSFTNKSNLQFLRDFDIKLEKLAFIPQLLFSIVLVPLRLSKIHTSATFFIQTFIFVAFNKVITSQYFIWYMCLLPMYLSTSTLGLYKGIALALSWVITQALWLFNGYRLEFLGEPVFTYGIWGSSLVFFVCQVYLICEFISDVRAQSVLANEKKTQ